MSKTKLDIDNITTIWKILSIQILTIADDENAELPTVIIKT